MLERSTIAVNALECLHNEQYDAPFNVQNLNHSGMVFMGLNRRRESLAGHWKFTPDVFDTGLRQKWFTLPERDLATRRDPFDYDPFQGEEVPVPSCWQTLKPEWTYFEGSAWYTRHWEYIPQTPGERVFLRVGAAAYDCKVFVNHVFVGNHYGASTPFFADLTPCLRLGDNVITCCVNNDRSADRVPMRNMDWFNYGGIYRDIEIVRTPSAYIKDLFIALKPDSGFSMLTGSVTVVGNVEEAVVRIPELGVLLKVPLGTDGHATFAIPARPELWSPKHPRLYEVLVDAGMDTVSDRVGFRDIRVEGTTILLNGKSVYLRGINVHEDDPQTGKMTNEADLRRRFSHVRELNANCVRLAHYPHHELAARLADEMGILLWEELPVYWAINFDNPHTRRDAANQMRELVLRDRNRASVIIWSLGNETADTDVRLSFMAELAADTRKLDPTRLLSAACLVNHATMRIEDRLVPHLDVIGLNEYYGWYEERFEDLIDLGANSNPNKPVLITETGAEAVYGDRVPGTGEVLLAEGLFSEAYMANVYRKQTDCLAKLPYIKGFIPWLLYDYRTERRRNFIQNGNNLKGLITADKLHRKQAFFVLRDVYAAMLAKDNA